MITLAVFDMAGTTIDEGGSVYVALRKAVEATGATVTDADLQAWMGRDKIEAITALMKLGGEHPDATAVASAFTVFKGRLAAAYAKAPPRPLPGVLDAFASLRATGASIFLTTGFSRDVAEPLLRGLGWDGDVVDGWVCTDDVSAGRPAPYLIYRAMERAGCTDVGEVLVAGDTVADVMAGRAARAGIVLAVTTGEVPRDELESAGPHAVLDSLAGIIDLLDTTAAATGSR